MRFTGSGAFFAIDLFLFIFFAKQILWAFHRRNKGVLCPQPGAFFAIDFTIQIDLTSRGRSHDVSRDEHDIQALYRNECIFIRRPALPVFIIILQFWYNNPRGLAALGYMKPGAHHA